jgi:hypothetical protein
LPAEKLDLDLIVQEMAEQGKTTGAQAVQRLADVEQAQDFAKNEVQAISDHLRLVEGIGARSAAITAEVILVQAQTLNLDQIRSHCFPQLAATFTDALDSLSQRETHVQTSYAFLLRILGMALSLGGLMEAVRSEEKQQNFQQWLESLKKVADTLQQPHGFQDQATGTRALTLEAHKHVNLSEVLDGVPRFVVSYDNINQDFEFYCNENRFELAGGQLCQIDVPLPSQMGHLRLYFWSTVLYEDPSGRKPTSFDDFFRSTFPEASEALETLSSTQPVFPVDAQHFRMHAEDDAELRVAGPGHGPVAMHYIGEDDESDLEGGDLRRGRGEDNTGGGLARSLAPERLLKQMVDHRERSRGQGSRAQYLHLDQELSPRLPPGTWRRAAQMNRRRRRSRSRGDPVAGVH